MGDLAQKVIRDIEAATTFEDVSDWIWKAGELIRKANNEGYYCPFEEVNQETVSMEERNLLKKAALHALERNSDPLWTGSMLSVLSRTGDSDLTELWIDSLNVHLSVLTRANSLVYTALQAVREAGEPVFEGVSSVCLVDVDRNVEEANKVLIRHGSPIHW